MKWTIQEEEMKWAMRECGKQLHISLIIDRFCINFVHA